MTAGSGFQSTFTFNGPGNVPNNRIDGYSYDAAGNLLNDGFHSYTYDAENRIISVGNGATTYLYDGLGRRAVRNTGGTLTGFYYDREGNLLSYSPPVASAPLEELYVAGTHLGTYVVNGSGTDTIFYYDHADWLGTERARTNLAGTACETIQSLPFGDGQAIAGSCGDISPLHFTGKERDTESGLDMFGARYYGSSLGRFMTPDWATKPTNVPYAHFGNPQSLNLYSYVQNNPTTVGDPDGHGVIDWPALVQAVSSWLSSSHSASGSAGVDAGHSVDKAGPVTINSKGLYADASGSASYGSGGVRSPPKQALV